MKTANAYRLGESYQFEPPEIDGKLVTLGLLDDVYAGTSAKGQQLFYRHHYPYGQTLEAALRLGWCWIIGEEDDVSP
jgi:hypothetical protein